MTTEQGENALGGHCAHRYARVEFGKNVAVCADCGADIENAKVSFCGGSFGGYTWGAVASLHTEQAGAVLPRPTSLQAWQDERASILKTKPEQLDSMQTELTRLREDREAEMESLWRIIEREREENRVLREGLEKINEMIREAENAGYAAISSYIVASSTLAAADKIRGGV